MNGGAIHLPARIKDRPDRERLALRFEHVVSPGVNEFIIPNYKQTWAGIRKIADAPEGVRHLTFKSQEYTPS